MDTYYSKSYCLLGETKIILLKHARILTTQEIKDASAKMAVGIKIKVHI